MHVVAGRCRTSLSTRISLGFFVMLTLIIIMQAATLAWVIARRERSVDERRAVRLMQTQAVSRDLEQALTTNPAADLSLLLRGYSSGILVLMKDGRVAGTPSSDIDVPGAIARIREGGNDIPQAWRVGSPAASPLFVRGTLQGAVAFPPPPIWREVGPSMVVIAALLLATGSIVLSLVVVRPIRRRIRRLQDAAYEFGRGNLGRRAPDLGADEIAELSRTFNVMADDLSARTTALETSDRLRRQLIADVSHELLTPLTAVMGRLETLLMPEVRLNDHQRERTVTVAMREARRIERLIGDLLDAARLESGIGRLDIERFCVLHLLNDVAARHERAVAAKQIDLQVQAVPEQLQMHADPFRIEQALDNLLVNALRHTPASGRIVLRATEDHGAVTLSVQDSGAGIAPEHLPYVFDRLYKASSADGTASPGHGLGLSIVKAIAIRHGGIVRADSTVGVGTTISLLLPAERVRGGSALAHSA